MDKSRNESERTVHALRVLVVALGLGACSAGAMAGAAAGGSHSAGAGRCERRERVDLALWCDLGLVGGGLSSPSRS